MQMLKLRRGFFPQREIGFEESLLKVFHGTRDALGCVLANSDE